MDAGTGNHELVEHAEIEFGHLGSTEIAAGQAERSHVMIDQCRVFGRAIANPLVLHQHRPAL